MSWEHPLQGDTPKPYWWNNSLITHLPYHACMVYLDIFTYIWLIFHGKCRISYQTWIISALFQLQLYFLLPRHCNQWNFFCKLCRIGVMAKPRGFGHLPQGHRTGNMFGENGFSPFFGLECWSKGGYFFQKKWTTQNTSKSIRIYSMLPFLVDKSGIYIIYQCTNP